MNTLLRTWPVRFRAAGNIENYCFRKMFYHLYYTRLCSRFYREILLHRGIIYFRDCSGNSRKVRIVTLRDATLSRRMRTTECEGSSNLHERKRARSEMPPSVEFPLWIFLIRLIPLAQRQFPPGGVARAETSRISPATAMRSSPDASWHRLWNRRSRPTGMHVVQKMFRMTSNFNFFESLHREKTWFESTKRALTDDDRNVLLIERNSSSIELTVRRIQHRSVYS